MAQAAMALMSCRRHFVRLDPHVEQPLDLGHHLVVRLLVALHHAVVRGAPSHPDVHVLHVPIEELDVLLFLHETASRRKARTPSLEQAPEEHVAETL